MKSLILLCLATSSVFGQSFLNAQLQYAHVRTAHNEKDSALKALSRQKGLPYPPRSLYFRAFKNEAQLEAWSQMARKDSFILLASYPICSSSGVAGPKIQAGDGQVPEGVYNISVFNPLSSYYLSLGVSYPNTVDRARSAGKNTGGDIFIHGDCVTIGCIPLTDDKIKEVYLLAVRARANGQQTIPIHIFPSRLTQSYIRANPAHTGLWSQLKNIYDRFEATRRKLRVSTSNSGYKLE